MDNFFHKLIFGKMPYFAFLLIKVYSSLVKKKKLGILVVERKLPCIFSSWTLSLTLISGFTTRDILWEMVDNGIPMSLTVIIYKCKQLQLLNRLKKKKIYKYLAQFLIEHLLVFPNTPEGRWRRSLLTLSNNIFNHV